MGDKSRAQPESSGHGLLADNDRGCFSGPPGARHPQRAGRDAELDGRGPASCLVGGPRSSAVGSPHARLLL